MVKQVGINDGGGKVFRHSSFLNFIRLTLLFGCAFLVSWGAGLQNIADFEIAKLFPLCASGLIVYWLVFTRRRFDVFPRSFNLFMLYIIIQTCIVYGIFHPEEFTFGITNVTVTTDGFTDVSTGRGYHVLRFFLFAGFAYAVASLIRNQRELVRLSLFYAAGFLISFTLGNHSVSSVGSVVRSTGGFLNPNSLGLSAMVAVFLSLAIVRSREVSRTEKNIAIGLMIVSLYALVSSVARSSIMATSVGLIAMTILEPMKRKFRMMFIGAGVGIILTIFIPSFLEPVQERFNSDYMSHQQYGMRVPIFFDYIKQWRSYIVTGVGLNRAIEVTKWTYSATLNWTPHNAYLSVLVEFGFLGLILFLSTMWSLWRRIIPSKPAHFRLSESTTYAGLFVAFAVFFIVGEYSTREFWLYWAIIAVYGGGTFTSQPSKNKERCNVFQNKQ